MELEPFCVKSPGDLVDLISRFTTNAFTLTSSSLSAIGVAISPTVALVNHSCDPNVVIVFPRNPSTSHAEEPMMTVVAIKPILPGEEILSAYVDVTQPRELRQKELKETYNFTCQQALDKATVLQYEDPVKAQRLTTNIIPLLDSARLTPSCHPFLALSRLHKELRIAYLGTSLTQENLDETIRATAKYSSGLIGVLAPGHPVRGTALAELGKLLAVDEISPLSDTTLRGDQFPPSGPARLKLAHETLVRALSELVVGFGTDTGGGEVGRDVRETVVKLEKELEVWTHGVKNVLEDGSFRMSIGA
ncbi:uncharacterized protein FIBRA_02849 [Fibroporia radiculosa]|uniref:SET domain-containing protein n=1 Tax=Fibroporia radiculosa TaxID=599839 RepID=J4HVL2_9APHY|nr:uncharacterized protein FIBRA_02849 [Fibroporia radiculosa]CCM00807.1 predicted protein [Fibroporia radiculosa]